MTSIVYLNNPFDLSGLHADIEAIYTSNGWGAKYSIGTIEKMVRNSTTTLALRNQTVIALARAFSDSVTVTHISEIVVHKDYQQRGIGSALLSKILIAHQHASIYVEALKSVPEKFLEKAGLQNRSRQLTVYSAMPLRSKTMNYL